jgi:hypothetical protein
MLGRYLRVGRQMLAKFLALAIVIANVLLALSGRASADDGHRFVTEYIRQLGAIESLREKAEIENKKELGNTSAIFSSCIRNSERFQLELAEHATLLQSFKLRADVQAVTSGLAQFYNYKIKIWQEISSNCSALLSGPEAGVDYSILAANAPKLTARLEYTDKSIFQTVPLVFASLIDPRPDSQNHLSHLTITKAQRDELVLSINRYFGRKLNLKDQNYTVSAASVLKGYLAEKGYKCSDEGW